MKRDRNNNHVTVVHGERSIRTMIFTRKGSAWNKKTTARDGPSVADTAEAAERVESFGGRDNCRSSVVEYSLPRLFRRSV